MPIGSNNDTGDVLQIAGLPAGVLNADLVPSTYVGQYKWISLYIGTDAYAGILTPQVSFTPSDSTSWKTIKMIPMTSLDAGDVSAAGISSTSNIVLGSLVFAPYFRMRMTSYTSGSATGLLSLYKDGMPGLQLLDTYVRLLTSTAYIGRTNNDGTQTVPIAAGTVADTAVAVTGGMLARILVTAAGTHDMTFYDNNAAASGTIVGYVPASPTVNGVPIVCKMPTSTGIYVAGNANNSGVTVSIA